MKMLIHQIVKSPIELRVYPSLKTGSMTLITLTQREHEIIWSLPGKVALFRLALIRRCSRPIWGRGLRCKTEIGWTRA